MFIWIFLSLVTLYFLLVLAAVIAVMLDYHQPAETIAWILVIMGIPVLGLVLYYFFGQNIRRHRIMGKKSIDLLTQKVMARYVSQKVDYREDTRDGQLIHFFKLHSIALPFAGNRIKAYTWAGDWLIDLLRDIGKARHHIHMEYFIIEDDPVGRLVRDALLDAVKRGVQVKFIYDDVGCWGVPKRFFRQMEEAGIEVMSFMPVRFPSLAHRVNYRNHRKITVIDGLTGYIGGMNLALRYVRGPRSGGDWFDLHLRVSGAGVYGIQIVFLSDWYIVSRQMVNDPIYYPDLEQAPATDPKPQPALMQTVISAPFGIWPNIMLGYNKVLLSAQHYVFLQTPYFMPTSSLSEALQTAAMSGVKVQIMTAKKPGGFWLTWANESYFGEMLRAGVEIFLYDRGMLHSKLLVADDHICSIGSCNLDVRSLLDTFESTAFIYDDNIAVQARNLFVEARNKCRKLDARQWKKRSLRKRLLEAFVRLFSPLF